MAILGSSGNAGKCWTFWMMAADTTDRALKTADEEQPDEPDGLSWREDSRRLTIEALGTHTDTPRCAVGPEVVEQSIPGCCHEECSRHTERSGSSDPTGVSDRDLNRAHICSDDREPIAPSFG